MNSQRTGDQGLVKELNRAIVLNIIRNQSPISRAAISRVSGLNKATVSALVDELIEGQMVNEMGPGESSGGRRPQLLMFNERAGYVAGIDLQVESFLVTVLDLKTQVRWKRRVRFDRADGPETVLAQVSSLVDEGLRSLPTPPLGLMGVGIGLPGLVDHLSGRLIFAPNLRWEDVPVRSILLNHLQAPVIADNEANAGAIGEMWAGAAAGVRNLIYLSVGTGLGAGIMVNGELYRGTDGVAGELGHTTLDLAGPSCSCGSRGCWELYASEGALRQHVNRSSLASELAGLDRHEITVETVVGAAQQGDTLAVAALSSVGEYLGVGVANLVNGFNPAMVVIGGSMAAAGSYVIDPARRVMEQRALAYPRSRVRILASALGTEACAVGAGALVLQERFRLPAVTF